MSNEAVILTTISNLATNQSEIHGIIAELCQLLSNKLPDCSAHEKAVLSDGARDMRIAAAGLKATAASIVFALNTGG